MQTLSTPFTCFPVRPESNAVPEAGRLSAVRSLCSFPFDPGSLNPQFNCLARLGRQGAALNFSVSGIVGAVASSRYDVGATALAPLHNIGQMSLGTDHRKSVHVLAVSWLPATSNQK